MLDIMLVETARQIYFKRYTLQFNLFFLQTYRKKRLESDRMTKTGGELKNNHSNGLSSLNGANLKQKAQ